MKLHFKMIKPITFDLAWILKSIKTLKPITPPYFAHITHRFFLNRGPSPPSRRSKESDKDALSYKKKKKVSPPNIGFIYGLHKLMQANNKKRSLNHYFFSCFFQQ